MGPGTQHARVPGGDALLEKARFTRHRRGTSRRQPGGILQEPAMEEQRIYPRRRLETCLHGASEGNPRQGRSTWHGSHRELLLLRAGPVAERRTRRAARGPQRHRVDSRSRLPERNRGCGERIGQSRLRPRRSEGGAGSRIGRAGEVGFEGRAAAAHRNQLQRRIDSAPGRGGRIRFRDHARQWRQGSGTDHGDGGHGAKDAGVQIEAGPVRRGRPFRFRKTGQQHEERHRVLRRVGFLRSQGYQSMPVDWSIRTDRQKSFFQFLGRVTGV